MALHTKKTMPAWYMKSRQVIYYLLSLLEVLLGFRFIFMLLEQIPKRLYFFLYSITGIFIAPFSGIFSPDPQQALPQDPLDPATLIAMLIYALAAWGIVRLED